jgi:RNA polymerase sigma-70 factor (ECF subfamily)
MPETLLIQAGISVEPRNSVPDSELVRRAQARLPNAAQGSGAVCELYDRYHLKIFRYFWSRLGDRQTAEDLTNEVFIRMIHGLPKYTSTETPFQAWLFRIAHNLAIDFYRKENSKPVLSLDQIDQLGDNTGDPANHIEGRLFLENIIGHIRGLQLPIQEVIILRFFIGLPIQEVAAILGKTVGAVKIAQHRGIQELRSILKGETGEEDHE